MSIEKQSRVELKIVINQLESLIVTIEESLARKEGAYFNYSSFLYFATQYNGLLSEAKKHLTLSTLLFEINTKGLTMSNTAPIVQRALVESTLLSARMLKNSLLGQLDFAQEEIENIEMFISKQFRKAFIDRPSNEKEVQDKLEILLIGRNMEKGMDYDRETGKFKFSGKEYIPDFIIPKSNLCIEIKLIKDEKRKSSLIEEINADITAYSKEYNSILFIIYDIGCIRDELEFKRDIERNNNVKLLIIKH